MTRMTWMGWIYLSELIGVDLLRRGVGKTRMTRMGCIAVVVMKQKST